MSERVIKTEDVKPFKPGEHFHIKMLPGGYCVLDPTKDEMAIADLYEAEIATQAKDLILDPDNE